MKEKDIAKKLELWLHLIPNGFSIATAIFLAVEKQYAPLQNNHACWVGVYPQGCLVNPDVKCERGSAKTPIYAKFLAVIPVCTTYFLIVAIMMVILYHVLQQKRRSDRWRVKEESQMSCCCWHICALPNQVLGITKIQEETMNKNISSKSHQQPKSPQMNTKIMRMRESVKYSQIAKFGVCSPSEGNVANSNPNTSSPGDDVDEENIGTTIASRTGSKQDPLSFNVNKVKSMIRRESNLGINEEIILSTKKPEKQEDPLRAKSLATQKSTASHEINATAAASTQCLLYIWSFLLCYSFTITSRIYGIIGRPAPFPVLLLSRFFLPLQGLFFVLIYSKPHIRSIRCNDPDLTWFQAFVIALKGGGDNDSGDRNVRLVIDPEGIDAPRLPEEERKRRQEIIRQAYLRRSSNIRSSYYHRQRSMDESMFSRDNVPNYYHRQSSLPVSILDAQTVITNDEHDRGKSYILSSHDNDAGNQE